MKIKKKLLFVIPSLDAGGAEKSLVNLMHLIDKDKYEIDLYLFHKKGLFYNQLPSHINILDINENFIIFNQKLLFSIFNFLKKMRFDLVICRLIFFLISRMNKYPSAEQYRWKFINKSIITLSKKYDVAIGYLEKSSNYFIVDRVDSAKKIAYIHGDYLELKLDKNFDEKYFNKIDVLVTISEHCKVILDEIFHNVKVEVVDNISPFSLVKVLSEEKIVEKFNNNSILSIGRLHYQKGFDIAIEAAAILNEKKIDFTWYIIGVGSERKKLENLIKFYNLEKKVIFLGNKSNPYPYIKAADIYAQPSRYEGKAIALDEAKILKKSILVTNFSTVKDQFTDNKDAIFADINAKDIAEKLEQLLKNENLRKKIANGIEVNSSYENEVLEKFYRIIND